MLALTFRLVALLAISGLFSQPANYHRVDTGRATVVEQCRDVELIAAYLSEEEPGQGSGFLVTVKSERSAPIAIVDPPPLSVHWYAESRGRWLWRSSSGSGGALVNAGRPAGPVFASGVGDGTSAPRLRVIAPRGMYTWAVFSGEESSLRYRPGCEGCTYKGEAQFRAVLAYAYVPSAGDDRLLRCGLRSSPVVMPPLSGVGAPHNSAR